MLNKGKLKVDAAESNAGDDFHILWAARKSLELLNFEDDGLKALTIEGLDEKESESLDPTGELLLGVDITEYYGGVEFIDSKRVVVSQLKYSTRRSHMEWTASRITKDNKGKTSGSIIGRFSQLFKGLLEKFGEKEILGRLSLKLVSNRPVSDLLKNTILLFQSYIAENSDNLSVEQFKSKLDQIQIRELDTLLNGAALEEKAALIFIRLLDVSDCGVGSRLYHHQQIVKAIGELGSMNSLNELGQLRDLIWSKMMPEQRGFNKITKEDILYKFGISDISDLFPVVSQVSSSANSVIREQLVNIAQQVTSENCKLVCLHAGAGMGKSTIIRQVTDSLPETSISILFDSYGNGAYDDLSDKRHCHDRGMLQICNELALKVGTPLLLETKGTSDFYIREFQKRINEAGRILSDVDSSAIIAIVIDAADNSVSAAEKYREKSFVHDIVRMNLPKNCRLIVTTRTERMHTLLLPDECSRVVLNHFSLAETTKFLDHYLSELNNESILEFYRYTKATPRVMSYAMELPGSSIDDKMLALKPDGKSLEEVFRLSIKEAIKKHGDQDAVGHFLKYLSSLPSPVPAAYLSDLARVTDKFIEDVSVDLWSGLVLSNGKVSFRDEDFETYVRANYVLNEEEKGSLANCLLSKADYDEYGSSHLGIALVNSRRIPELMSIVLERQYLNHPKDPIRNREVFVSRTKLAMQHCQPSGIEFLKLQMIAAEASKTNKAIEEILINRADLASAYGNVQTNKKLYFQSGQPGWFGSAHYRSAAILSRKEETKDLAKKHLVQARKWREYRALLSDEELREYKLDKFDLANGAEAVLRITEDINECIDWVKDWRASPKYIMYGVVEALIDNIHSDVGLLRQLDFSAIQRLRIDVQALIAKKFFEINADVPIKVDMIITQLKTLRKDRVKMRLTFSEALIRVAEYLFYKGYNNDDVRKLLDLSATTPPDSSPYFYSFGDDNIQMDTFFRKEVLLSILNNKEVVIVDLLPVGLRETLIKDGLSSKERNSYKEQEEKFLRIYRHLLPMYMNRAKGILGLVDDSFLESELGDALLKLDRDYNLNYRHSHQDRLLNLFMAEKLLDIVFFKPDRFVAIIEEGYANEYSDNIEYYISIAYKLLKNSRFYPLILKKLNSIDKLIAESALPASKKVDFYGDLSKIANLISNDAGKIYFDSMVQASSEIDLEAHEQIKCINYMLRENEYLFNPKLALNYAKYIEYCYSRLQGWDHFPWASGVEAIAKLDVGSAFQVVCQWDHRRVRELDEHFIEVLLIALKSDFLSPEIAGGVLPFWIGVSDLLIDVAAEILKGFDKKGDYNNKNIFVRYFTRDLKLRCNSIRTFEYVEKFYSLIENGTYLSRELVVEFGGYCKGVQSLLDATKSDESYTDKYRSKEKLEEKYKLFLVGRNLLEGEEIREVLNAAKEITSNKYVDDLLLFKLIHQRIPDLNCIDYLNMFLNLEGELINEYYFYDILSDAFAKWGDFPQVKLWKHKVFEGLVRRRFLSYFEFDNFNTVRLRRLSELFEISESQLSNVVRKILPEYLEALTPDALYQMFELTSLNIVREEKVAFVEWTLAQWNGKIMDPFYSHLFMDSNNQGTGDLTIAAFIRYSLGNPDKRIRWRAMHSIRRLSGLGNITILCSLIETQNIRSCLPFQHQEYNFYWISAKVYLWIAIERISLEFPEHIESYSQLIFNELISAELPHAQLKYFVWRVCHNLKTFNKSFFSEEQTECIINYFNEVPVSPASKSEVYEEVDVESIQTRFEFDSMDTLPYWYEPLGRVFGVSVSDVAVLADKYIAEYWGYSGEVWSSDHLRDSPYELISNRHGSAPTIENFQIYLEYNAMFCAAMELLRSKAPVREDEWQDDFLEWLKGWTKHWDNFWLSDFRDGLPLERRFWSSIRNKEEWEWNFGLSDFEQGVGIEECCYPGYLHVRGGVSIYYGEDCETQYVASALVKPHSAFSLLRTLQAASKYDFSIPAEKEGVAEESDYDPGDFRLDGWIKCYKATEGEGVDDRDEIFQGIEKARLMPGDVFSSFVGLTFSEDYRYSFDSNGSKVSILESWSNIPDKISEHYDLFASGGSRLFIRKSDLLRFLKSSEKVLVLVCELSRRPKKRDYDSNSFYKQVFLVYGDGSVKTLSRDYKIG